MGTEPVTSMCRLGFSARAVPTCLLDIRIGSLCSLDAGTASVRLAYLKDRIAAELHVGIRAEDATVRQVSNTDTAPAEVACAASTFAGVLHPREVPLGGPRAIRVRRTLPQRERSLIGAWCFADHYGPHDVRGSVGMDVPPHPHTGLQTVSWLFEGEVEHRDSAGVHALVRPGELNLMTAGRGHLPLGGLHRRDDRPARGPAVGRAARLRSRHRPRLRPLCARARLGPRRRPSGVPRRAFG